MLKHFTMKRWRDSTPLCPAGHLPLKGGDYAFIDGRYQSQALKAEACEPCQPIAPLEGEMSPFDELRRTEGGETAVQSCPRSAQ
jgi:hypothetical protein